MRTSVLLSLYKGSHLLPGYLKLLEQQTLFPEFELVVRVVVPTGSEIQMLQDFQKATSIPMLVSATSAWEPLGRTWNELVSRCQGEFVAVWNVDDVRFAKSLQEQEAALAERPNYGGVFGPFYIDRSGRGLTLHEKMEPTPLQMQTGFHLGPFPMFRKSLLRDAGGFDEQFHTACDYDLALRMNEHCHFAWIPEALGTFTHARSGLSTSSCRGLIERTAIDYRYGLHWKVNPIFARSARRFSMDTMTVLGQPVSLKRHLPEIEEIRERNCVLDMKRNDKAKELFIAARCVARRLRGFATRSR